MVDLQLFINDKQWSTINVEMITIHHGWKAEKLFYNVKKEMENEKEIDW